ncbi:hypothetical protein D9756_009837 [Leucocoprinus leucothites]|uniref:Uncharacterized protein n=1 Tax=Leucocoprinus leucothites TaxID=201217 RepID=A0A8H5FTW4_9AGAR|nr:hypothetical protein D9756_009837 [Leucoagaricus leucothites]
MTLPRSPSSFHCLTHLRSQRPTSTLPRQFQYRKVSTPSSPNTPVDNEPSNHDIPVTPPVQRALD